MKKTYSIKGMHCRSCEVLIENEIKNIQGVRSVHASNKKSQVVVDAADSVRNTDIIDAINRAGYEVGDESLPYFRASLRDLVFIVASFLLIGAIYYIAKDTGTFDRLGSGFGAGTSLAAVFVVGIAAGLSTCMALVGGLVLGASARFAEKHPNATAIQKFRPHLFFNLGRVVSFFVLGGVIGTLGSAIKFSSPVLGAFTIVVGIIMALLGLQLLEIFPKMSHIFVLPKSIARILGVDNGNKAEYSHKNSMYLGALTFFLPCGFTQAMQIFAVSTGSFWRGAMIMGVFALGTTPGLLGIGGLTSLVKRGEYAKLFFKFVGALVITLALYNVGNGVNLTGFSVNLPKGNSDQSAVTEGPQPQGVVQEIKATYSPNDYGPTLSPNEFTVKVGQGVRLSVLATADGEGCMGSIMIPGLVNTPQFFVKDETVAMNFVPKKVGKYKITCAMGIKSGTINVIE
jgi:sulfite exporter TauE/SafE/copper chaperone CopZ